MGRKGRKEGKERGLRKRGDKKIGIQARKKEREEGREKEEPNERGGRRNGGKV